MIDRIAQVSISVRDLARATKFYRDVVGLQLLFEVPNMAFFDCGGVRILVGTGEPAPPNTGSLIYFSTTDINAFAAKLRGEGVVFKTEPVVIAQLENRDVWLAHFEDGEGNLLSLMSEVPR